LISAKLRLVFESNPVILKNYDDQIASTELREGLKSNVNLNSGHGANYANLKASIDDLDLNDDDFFAPGADPFANAGGNN